MNPFEISGCIFTSSLKINYDRRFISTAQAFVQNLAGLSGADEKEVYQLTLLTEEALVFIMDKYIDEKLKAHIEIRYLLFRDGRIGLELSDMGRPIHEEKIPEFNIHDADTMDGLWYRMVKKLADEFEFINQVNRGWLIRAEKRIAQTAFSPDDALADTPVQPDVAPVVGPLSIRRATAEDAAALVDLAFMTYRYSNGVPEFYDADLLRTHIDEKLYDVMVVEVDQRIIGAVSIKYSDFDPKSAELGSAMVHPDYRKTRAAFMIFRETSRYHKENPRQVDFFVTFLVTTHAQSQKGVAKVHKGYKPLSISLNMIPRPNYIAIKEIAGTRESLLNAYHLNGPLAVEQIHAPARHAEIVRELLEESGNAVTVSTASAEYGAACPPNQTPNQTPNRTPNRTRLSSFVIDSLQSAIVTVETLGEEWFPTLCQTLLSKATSGCKTIIVSLPTQDPLPGDLDERLAGLGLIFCGLSLRSLQDVRLSYVLISEPVDFSVIELFSPVARKLLAHIEEQYRHMEFV